MSQTMIIMLAALGAELVLLVMVLLAASWFSNRGAKKRDAQAAAALVARVKQAKPERAAAIEKFLSSGMGMEGDQLEQAKTAMLRSELTLLQRFAGIYKKHDAAAAARFDGDVTAALEPYHALTAQGSAAQAEEGQAVDDQETEALRKENKRLSDELKITMETMSRMLNEYSTMFAGAETGDAAPISAVVGAGAAAAAVGQTDETQPKDVEGVVESEDNVDAEGATADDVSDVMGDALPENVEPALFETPSEQDDGEMEVALPADDGASASDSSDDSAVDIVTDEPEVFDEDNPQTSDGEPQEASTVDEVEDSASPVEIATAEDIEPALPDEGEIDIVAMEEPEQASELPADLDSDLFDMPADDIVDRADDGDAENAESQPAELDDDLFDASQEEEPKKNDASG